MGQEAMPSPSFPETNQISSNDDTGNENSPSEFANQYLKDIPDEHRSIVEQYVGTWDKNVTQKFQDYSGRLKGYEALGDVESLASAQQLWDMLNDNPVGFLEQLQQYTNEIYQPEENGMGTYDDDEEGAYALPEFDGDGDALLQQYQDLQERYSSLEERLNGFESSQQEKDEMKMLDSVLDDLHNTHGDFNEQWVLLQIANGADPSEAVQSWTELTQGIIDSRKSNPPPVLLGGPGGTPLDQVDKSALRDPATRKEYGTELLKAYLAQ